MLESSIVPVLLETILIPLMQARCQSIRVSNTVALISCLAGAMVSCLIGYSCF